MTFKDFNDGKQLLAFGFLIGREEKHFESFLNDIKNYIKNKICVFILDRWKGQLKEIKKIFQNSNIVFCRIHLERNIRTTFGDYSRIGSLFHQLMNGSINDGVYLKELKILIDQSKKHKKKLITLYNDINSFSPTQFGKLQLRGNCTVYPEEGLFGNFKSGYGHQRIPLAEIIQGIIGFHQVAIEKSMKFAPKKFKENICTSPTLSQLAFSLLLNEINKTSTIISFLSSNNEYLIENGRKIANTCNCTIKKDYGLPCSHILFNNYKKLQIPIIKTETIQMIYYYEPFNLNHVTETVNVEDPAI